MLALSLIINLFKSKTSLTSFKLFLKELLRLKDNLSISQKYLKLNRKYIFLASLGLMLAVAGITQAMITVNIEEAGLLAESLKSENIPPGLLISTYTPVPPKSLNPNYNLTYQISQDLHNAEKIAKESIAFPYPLVKVEDLFIAHTVNSYVYMDHSLNTTFWPIGLLGISYQSMLELWGPQFNGSWPEKPGEIIVLKSIEPLPDVQPNFKIGQNFTITNNAYQLNPYDPNAKIRTYKIVGTITLSFPIFYPVIKWADNLILPAILAIMPIQQAQLEWCRLGADTLAKIYSAFYYNYGEHVKSIELRDNLANLATTISVLMNNYENDGFHFLSSKSLLAQDIWWIANIIEPLRAVFLYLSVPIVGISFFLVDLSFNLVEARKRKLVGILKSRGSSNNQIIFSVIAEIMLASTIGLVFGVIAGYPLGALIISSTGFLRFGKISIPPFLYFPQFLKIIITGIVLGIDYNLPNLLETVKTNIYESDVPTEIRIPFWRKYQLDLFLFIVGVSVTILLKRIIENPEGGNDTLIVYLGAFSFLFVIVGAIMYISWHFSSFLKPIGKKMWDSIGNLFSFVLRSLSIRKVTSSKVVALIIVAALFTSYLTITPVTLSAYSKEKQYYTVGADISLIGLNFRLYPDYQQIIGKENISGFTEVIKLTTEAQINKIKYNVILMAINTTTFGDVAFFKSNYANKPLNTLIKELRNSSGNIHNVLVWSRTLEKNPQLKQQSLLTFEIYDSYWRFVLLKTRLQVVDTFEYWPNLLLENTPKDSIIMVMDLNDLVPYLYSAPKSVQEKAQFIVYADVKQGLDIVSVAESIRYHTFSKLHYYQFRYVGQKFLATPETVIISISVLINLGFIFSMITLILTVSMYALLAITERKREISLLRALGMLRKQLFSMFIMEIIVLVIFSIIIGLLTALIAVQTSVYVLVSEYFGGRYPPIYVVYPTRLLSIALTLLASIGVLSSIIPAYFYSQTKPLIITRD